MDHDNEQDRLIDLLLREELGREIPPNLTERILRAAGKTGKSGAIRLRGWKIPALLAATVALAVLCGLVIVRYRNAQQIVQNPIAPKDEFERGTEISTEGTGRSLQIGENGYCHVDVAPRTQIQRQGEAKAEELFIKRGMVVCEVDKQVGTFAVKSEAGVVKVTGTKFSVRVPEAKGGSNMLVKKMLVKVIAGAVVLSGGFGEVVLAADQEGGTVTGSVTSKGDSWIAVKADGQDEPEMYMPVWKGGAPKDGGGFDKDILEKLHGIPVGSKVKVAWKMDEHRRIAGVDVLEKPAEVARRSDRPRDGDKPRDAARDGDKPHGDGEKSGTMVGKVTKLGDNFVEVTSEKGEAQKFIPRYHDGGLDKDMIRSIGHLKVGEWVKLDWVQDEHMRVVKIQTAPR